MITKKMGSMLVVRLDKGEELVSSLLQIMDMQKLPQLLSPALAR